MTEIKLIILLNSKNFSANRWFKVNKYLKSKLTKKDVFKISTVLLINSILLLSIINRSSRKSKLIKSLLADLLVIIKSILFMILL